MGRSALLIIDMQNALVSGAHDEAGIVARIAHVLARARSARLPVIFVQHSHSSFEPLMKHQPGWAIHRALEPLEGETIIEKTASDAFYGTPLRAKLQELDVSTLLICGMQTEYCVDTTCRSALSRGFDVVLLSDCHTTGDASLTATQTIEHHNAVLANLAHPDHRVTLATSSDVSLP